MIVVDASVVVSAALKVDSTPRRALLQARRSDVIALSRPVYDEISEVLGRRKFERAITRQNHDDVIELLTGAAIWIEPEALIQECRDPKDDKYLELAFAAGAAVLLTSDADLLVMDPWRGVRLLRPAAYLAYAP